MLCNPTWRKTAVCILVKMHRDTDLLQVVVQEAPGAASRAACTAGKSRAISIPMIAITTSSSTSVKADRVSARRVFRRIPNPRVLPAG